MNPAVSSTPTQMGLATVVCVAAAPPDPPTIGGGFARKGDIRVYLTDDGHDHGHGRGHGYGHGHGHRPSNKLGGFRKTL